MRVAHGFWAPRMKRTAFNWIAYASRRGGLMLLRQGKVHVDTLITTEDGFSDTVHWQVIIALCPELIEASQMSQPASDSEPSQWRQLRLPAQINGLMARKLLECAYGEQVVLDRVCLKDFYIISRDFNISDAMDICLNYASTLIDIQNCIQLLLVGLRHRHHRLRRTAYLMIRSNFKLLLHVNDDFHLLPVNYLKRLLLDDFLKLNEDEEFAWLAILRWTKQNKMTLRQTIELYNRMVAAVPQVSPASPWPNAPNNRISVANKEYLRYSRANRMNMGQSPQLIEPSINFYTQSVPFDWTSDAANKAITRSPETLPLQMDNLVVASQAERDSQLFDLIKCLRFMRFRSLNAFNVILADDLVRGNAKLEQLVNHMRLMYMVKNKIPLNRVKLTLPITHLDKIKIKLDESKYPKRAMRLATGFVKHNIRLRPWSLTAAAGTGRIVSKVHQDPDDESASKLNNSEQQQEQEIQAVSDCIDQLTGECLNWADKPRVPNSVALLIGGWQDGVVSKSLVAYDFICDKWFKLNIRLPEPRAFHASCCLPKTSEIYILGGTNGETILNSVLRFNPAEDILTSVSKYSTKTSSKSTANTRATGTGTGSGAKLPSSELGHLRYQFHVLCPMNERRCHLSAVFHSDGKLYALGGHDGHQRLRSAEWYDVKANKWHPIAEMTIARSDASACSHDNKIFIAGGQISDQFIQSSVEFYKANDNTWTFAAPMIVPRMSFRLVSFRNLLLAIGGTNGLMGGDEVGSVTRSVERYNPSQSSWCLCTPLNQKRSSFGVMTIENNLIVAGGYGGRRRLKSCEALKIGHFTTSDQQPARPPIHLRFGSMISAQSANFGGAAAENNEPTLPIANRHYLAPSNNRLFSLKGLSSANTPIRSAMKWVNRADLPTRKSGFSVAVVGPLRNARDMTYHGSKRQWIKPSEKGAACVIKQRSKWHRLKFIKRRKLIKHLKIALVVTVVILIM